MKILSIDPGKINHGMFFYDTITHLNCALTLNIPADAFHGLSETEREVQELSLLKMYLEQEILADERVKPDLIVIEDQPSGVELFLNNKSKKQEIIDLREIEKLKLTLISDKKILQFVQRSIGVMRLVFCTQEWIDINPRHWQVKFGLARPHLTSLQYLHDSKIKVLERLNIDPTCFDEHTCDAVLQCVYYLLQLHNPTRLLDFKNSQLIKH